MNKEQEKNISSMKNCPFLFHAVSFRSWIPTMLTTKVNFYRFLFIVIKSLLVIIFFPLRAYESLKLKKAIAQTTIKEPPVFIIGCFRSGTTYLHNLLACHSKFGYITSWESFGFPYAGLITKPNSFINNKFKNLKIKRPMDNLIMGYNTPEEEEFAIGSISSLSFIFSFLFKDKLENGIQKYLLFNGMTEKNIAKWKSAYLYVLKKITYLRKNKQLLLKSPYNTSRIKWLLELFPHAKFIYIYRNPYEVFASLMNLFQINTNLIKDNKSNVDLEKQIFTLYEKMMLAYFDQKALIPEGNLIEVKYENLMVNPLSEVERIFSKLQIQCSEADMNRLKHYLDKQKTYKKNQFKQDEEMTKKIYENWQAIINKLGYS